MQNERGRSPKPEPSRSRPNGRPKGAVTLTKERMEMIVAFIRAGAFDYVAAEAAGISERTFHEWIARGEGRHPNRGSTPKLRDFADQVRIAHAEARLAAELTIYKAEPRTWLRQVARTKPGREGWTDPPKEEQDGSATVGSAALRKFSDDELDESYMRLQQVMAESHDFWAPPCPHPRCRCPWHKNWRQHKRELEAKRPRRRP
jgi:hypothetical protein